jgi:hypothetical protein
MQSKNKNSIAAGVLVVLWCFGGVVPSYASIQTRLHALGILLNHCSPFKWSFEMQVIITLPVLSECRMTPYCV